MAEPINTSTSPAKQATDWKNYLESNPSGIINSTGYQLYAVTGNLLDFTPGDVNTINVLISTGTLNLQLADVAYNTQNQGSALTRQ